MKNRLAVFPLSLVLVVVFACAAYAAQPQRPPALPSDYEGLVKLFNAEKNLPYSQRYRTINALGNCKDPRALEFLMKVYPGEKDQSVKRAILSAVGRFPDPRALNFLFKAYSTETDRNLKSAILSAIGRSKDPKAVNFLMKEYDKPENAANKSNIIRALASSKDPRVFKFLTSKYGSEKDVNTKRNIVQSIGRMKSEEAAKWLTAVYRKTDQANIKSAAARSLAGMADLLSVETLKELIQIEDVYARKSVASALGKLGTKEAINVLLEAYAKDWPYETKNKKAGQRETAQQRARQQLKTQFPGAVSAALAAVSDNDTILWLAEEVLASEEKHHLICREIIIPFMGTKKEERAVRNLIAIVKDGKPRIQRLAALALAEIGDTDAVPSLIEAGKGDVDIDVKAAIANALGKLADPRAKEFLLELAKDRNWQVQAAAVRALGNIPCRESIDAAIRATKEKAWQVQLAGVLALRKLRVKEAIDPLLELVKKTDGRIRMEALEALREIMDMDLGEDYREWAKWWKKNRKGFLVLPKAEPSEETEEDKKDIAKKNDPNRKRPKNPYKTSAKPTSRPKFFGTEIYSSRVIFIIDISGSMSSNTQKTDEKGRSQSIRKIEYAKNELINAVRQLKKKAMFNLYFFESTFTKWKPRMVCASVGAKTAAVKWVRSMGPRGGTNIYDTVEDALGDPNVDTIYLLSDGAPGQGKWTRMEDILREVKKINEHKNVQINTISFGQDSELMRKLAEQNGGQYIYKK